jgi:hypothetical protein
LGQTEQQVLTEESIVSRKKLSDLENAIPALIENITGQQETFAQSVDAVLAKVQFPVAVAKANSRSVGFFQDLVAWSNDGAPEVTADSASQKIDLLKSNYTMESERQAHAAALQLQPAASSATASQRVEMFDQFEPEPKPSPIDLPAVASAQLEPMPPLAPEKPAASEELGANVELF